MVKIDVITIFPRMVEAGLAEGVVGRARTAGLLDIVVHNLRDFTTDKHHVVDDVPFGGGPGMVMKPEPFFAALAAIRERRGTPDAVVLLTPAGERFTQDGARRLAAIEPRGVPVRALRGDRRAGARGARDGRDFDRRLRAVGRRSAGAGGDRRGRAGWCPAWSATSSRWKRIRSRAACWTIRTTRGPRSSRDGRCPTCCCRGITARFGDGGAKRRCSGRSNGGRTCWPDAALDADEREWLKRSKS